MSDSPIEPEAQSPSEGSKSSISKKDIEKSSLIEDIETIIPEEVQPILEKLEREEKITMIRAFVGMSVSSTTWRGPLPDPKTLKGYNDCFEGGAKAVFDLTKDQSQHRMELEKTVINRELNQSGRGQNYAFTLALILFLAAVFLAYVGHDWVAGIAIGFDVIGLAAVFIAGKYGIKLDLSRKMKEKKNLNMEQEEEEEED